MKAARAWFGILAVTLACLVGSVSASPPTKPVRPAVAPDFRVTQLNGRVFQLSQHRGRPVVINFMASWCPPCRQEMPEYARLARQTRGRVDFLFVADDREDVLRRWVRNNWLSDLNFAVDNGVMRKYEVPGLPTTVVIRPNGTIYDYWFGYRPGRLYSVLSS